MTTPEQLPTSTTQMPAELTQPGIKDRFLTPFRTRAMATIVGIGMLASCTPGAGTGTGEGITDPDDPSTSVWIGGDSLMEIASADGLNPGTFKVAEGGSGWMITANGTKKTIDENIDFAIEDTDVVPETLILEGSRNNLPDINAPLGSTSNTQTIADEALSHISQWQADGTNVIWFNYLNANTKDDYLYGDGIHDVNQRIEASGVDIVDCSEEIDAAGGPRADMTHLEFDAVIAQIDCMRIETEKLIPGSFPPQS